MRFWKPTRTAKCGSRNDLPGTSGVQRDLLDGYGIDGTDCFTAATPDTLGLVNPEPVVIQRVRLALFDAGITGNPPLFVAKQRSNLHDASLDRFHLQAFVAKNA